MGGLRLNTLTDPYRNPQQSVDTERELEGTDGDDGSNIDTEEHDGEEAEASREEGMAITLHFLLES